MKIRTLIPAIIAVALLLHGPFSYRPICDSDPHGGLICYCCSSMGKNCTMISCSGCSGAHGGSVIDRWSPEMILESFHPISPLRFVYSGKETFRAPETVYLEVLDKPPKRA